MLNSTQIKHVHIKHKAPNCKLPALPQESAKKQLAHVKKGALINVCISKLLFEK
jgi:hypothetical protein